MEGTMEARRAAAVAGVLKYLAERTAAGVQPGVAGQASPGGAAGAQAGPWALYGRQALMNQRIRMQARRRR